MPFSSSLPSFGKARRHMRRSAWTFNRAYTSMCIHRNTRRTNWMREFTFTEHLQPQSDSTSYHPTEPNQQKKYRYVPPSQRKPYLPIIHELTIPHAQSAQNATDWQSPDRVSCLLVEATRIQPP